ncbi:MAG: metal ABC transporter permease, partial [Bacteroidota bacterium]
MEAYDIWLRLLELPNIYWYEPIFQRALLAGVMVGITCGVLGCFFVLRNMALIGDALSHAILPGLVFAFVFFGYNTFAFFIGSTLAGMITAVLITWISQNIRTKADAAI